MANETTHGNATAAFNATAWIEDATLFCVRLSTNPAKAIEELPHVAAAFVGVLLFPTFVWLLLKNLSGEKKVNALKNWAPKSFLEEAEELREAALAAPQTDTPWEVGVSSKAIAVSEDGQLRAYETLLINKPATATDITAVLVKAIAQPLDQQAVHRARIASFLQSRQCSDSVVGEVAKRLQKFDMRADTAEALAGELEEYLKKRKEEMAKGVPAPQVQPGEKPQYAPMPKRGCSVCHQEIEEKPSQCSACKAMIYCGPDCAKKDWPSHKAICPTFKSYMQRVEKENLNDLPFDFYNIKKQLQSYNQVTFLVHQNVHNVGVFRRLCGCYAQIPYGELAAEQMAQLAANNITNPVERFKLFGLTMDLFPLSAAYPEETNVREIDSWQKYYSLRKLSASNPAALVLEVPLTIWHIINKRCYDSVTTLPSGRRQLTIHLAGVEKEADYTALLEVLLSLLPKTDIAVHMVSPAISPRLPPQTTTLAIRNETLDSTVLITLRQSLYSPAHLSGEVYKTEQLPFGTGKPDLVIIMNASLLSDRNWVPTVKMLVEEKQKTVLTDSMEHTVKITKEQLMNLGAVFGEMEVNPFRMPVGLWKKDTNLPGWSNGFIYSMF